MFVSVFVFFELHWEHYLCGAQWRSESEALVCPFRLFVWQGKKVFFSSWGDASTAGSQLAHMHIRRKASHTHTHHFPFLWSQNVFKRLLYTQTYSLMQLSLLVPCLSSTEKPYRLCQKCWITGFLSPWVSEHLVWLSLSSRSRAMIIAVCDLHSPSTHQWRFSLQRHRVATKTSKWLPVRPSS